ncbi:MAG: sugar ABC transporter permease [Chloroflexota bacterium]|nr:sugar ABC transporter permease [Chloroflexota bacterium]
MIELSFWDAYGSTLLHWILVGAAIGLSMVLLNRALVAFGVKRETATGYALVLPWLLGLGIWILYPFARSLYLSFTQYNILQPAQWIGTDNYVKMFTGDKQFWLSLRLTILYSLFNVPLGTLGALGVALILNRDIKGIGVWRTIYYLPAVLPVVAVALLWRWMLSPSSGLINFLLSPIYAALDMEPLAWFTDPDLVLPSFVIMGMWGVFGANTIILLAGLKNVPRHLYDVADLDGANQGQKLRYVTIPMLSPTLFYVVITGIIASLQIFTQAFFIEIPRRAGTFLNVLIYREAFQFRHMGYASAIAWFQLILILLITLLVFKSSAAWVYYEGERR